MNYKKRVHTRYMIKINVLAMIVTTHDCEDKSDLFIHGVRDRRNLDFSNNSSIFIHTYC